MKIACVCMVLLIAATVRGMNPAISISSNDAGSILKVNGYDSTGVICSSGGEGVAKVACGGKGFKAVELSDEELRAQKIEYGMDLSCSGSEGSLSECTSDSGPGPLKPCGNSFVGCE